MISLGRGISLCSCKSNLLRRTKAMFQLPIPSRKRFSIRDAIKQGNEKFEIIIKYLKY